MYIEQLMSQPAVTCGPDDTLNTAARLMWENDCGALPVVNDEGRLVGMITDRDICMSAYTQGAPLDQLRVSGAMAKQVFSCHPKDSVDTAERLMSGAQIRRMPVVDDAQHPIGILSLNDIARHAATGTSDGIEHEFVQTLAAICQPRLRPPVTRERNASQPAPMTMQ